MAPSFFISFEKGGMAGVINTFQVIFLEVTPRMAALVFYSVLTSGGVSAISFSVSMYEPAKSSKRK